MHEPDGPRANDRRSLPGARILPRRRPRRIKQMDGEAVPDLSRTEAAIESPAVRSTSLVVIAVLATLYTLYFARAFFIPIVFAVLLNFLLSPLIRKLTHINIRPPLGAGIVVIGLLAAVGGGVYALAGPAQSA